MQFFSVTQDSLVFTLALLLAFLVGTLVEYVVHRLMHARILLGQKHLEHHKEGTAQGWWGWLTGSNILKMIIVISRVSMMSLFRWAGWRIKGYQLRSDDSDSAHFCETVFC